MLLSVLFDNPHYLTRLFLGLGTILFAIRTDNEELDDLKGKGIDRNRAEQSEPVIPMIIPGKC